MLYPAVMLLALNATPSPSPNAAPVAVDECRVAAAGTEFNPWDEYSITFENKAAVDAVEIEWMISWKHGPPGEVRSVGDFRPGQTVRQVLRQNENARIVRPFYGVNTPIACSVLFVRFSDGTQWAPKS
jgi:hypothetical protein